MIIIRKKRGVLRLRRNLFLKKVSGSSSSRVGTGTIFLVMFLFCLKKGRNHTRRGWGLPFFKKKDGEINARARALDTKRLAGITFSYHLPSNHDSIHFVAESSREDAFGKVLRAFRGG